MKTIQKRWILLAVWVGVFSFLDVGVPSATASVKDKSYALLSVGNPDSSLQFQFIDPDEFISPLSTILEGDSGTWTQVNMLLFATWQAETSFTAEIENVEVLIEETFQGFQVGPYIIG